MTVRVLVVDDQALIRAGFAAILGTTPGVEVVGEAADGAAAVDSARRLRPDVVLMDIRMPGVDGITATAEICTDPALVDVRVVVLTTFESDQYVFAALRAGASGFLGKDVDPTTLIAAVHTVAGGEALLSPRATRALIDHSISVLPAAAAVPGADRLTPREREIVGFVGRGLTNAQIADALVVSPLTVKTHVNRAMTKIGARDRAQLVVFAYQSGLVPRGQ